MNLLSKDIKKKHIERCCESILSLIYDLDYVCGDIENGYLMGTLKQEFCLLEKGTHVCIECVNVNEIKISFLLDDCEPPLSEWENNNESELWYNSNGIHHNELQYLNKTIEFIIKDKHDFLF